MVIKRKSDIFCASDEDINDFFGDVTFTGLFSDLQIEDNSLNSKFCGQIDNIRMNGIINDLCPKSLFVPNKLKAHVKKGLCEFKAVVDLKTLRGEKKLYKLFIINIKPLDTVVIKHDANAESKVKYNLKLRNNKFVGMFTGNKDGSFTIRDIRRSDFSKLILQNRKELQPIVFHPHIFQPQDGKYYEFTWVLNGEKENYLYLFKVDENFPFVEVTPKDLVKRLHDDIMGYPAGAGQKIVNTLDTLKNQLTANGKEIFIYELLQNANDYPFGSNEKKQPVDVEFHITLSSLVFMHSGSEFNEKNVAAICNINDKEKDTNKDAIGYKGIGFKTVFLDNENVYLQTGNYSFRFDRQATKDIVDTPWQVLPIWTSFTELTQAERAIFTLADKQFRVKFALKPMKMETLRDSSHNYEQMFRDVFKNERVILFIPNLSSVKIYLQGKPTPDIICNRSNDTWRVDDFQETIEENVTAAINEAIAEQENSGGLKIPTKYYDFNKTKVSFACEIEGNKLKAVDDTCLYCYLPAKEAKWGFKFLMNTDMIPNGPRDDIETDFANTINVNEKIAYIAGSKFFDWIYKLCESKNYNLDTVFNLIPDFDTIKENHGKYEDLIDIFKEGFDTRLENDVLVPVESGYCLLSDTILDKTGITSVGIIPDDLFLEYSDHEDKYLPILELRNSKSFNDFLDTYLSEFDSKDNVFDEDSLHEMIKNGEFINWLKIQDNNNKFLKFLLDNDILENFFDEEIFIEEEYGKLYSANSIYYDVDTELDDLKAFSDYIPYLSLLTRKFFANNTDWDNTTDGYFKTFDTKNFINEELLSENRDETIELLNSLEVSLHFYSFLAKNKIVPEDILNLSFFNDENEPEVVENFKDKFIFFSSIEGKEICDSSWISPITFAFISPKYDKETLAYFKENANVRDFSDSIIIKDIILSDDYQSEINDAQQENENSSIDFFNYCFKHKDEIETGNLKEYALSVVDKDGNKSFTLSEDHIYCPSPLFDEYSKKEWVNYAWMYCLDSIYLSQNSSLNKLQKEFLHKAFYIDEIDNKSFYTDVVKKNIKDIISTTSGGNDSEGSKNIDFVQYLDDNYKLIFEDKKDSDILDGFVILGDNEENGYDISPNAEHIYMFDNELKDIIDSDWFPSDIIDMCSSRYNGARSLIAIRAKKYVFSSFFEDVITMELSNINDNIDSKEKSIAFHQFIIERKKELLDKQKEVMKNVSLYLYGSSSASSHSCGHKTLSAKAKELFEKGLVDFSDLDIIDPEYKTGENPDYWETILGNSKFSVTDFLSWLSENTDSFIETIENKELNVSFWRWLKENKISDKALESLPVLPVFLNNDEYEDSDSIIYLSDEYIDEGGLETIVTKYNPDASFISADYIGEEDDIEDWKNFWAKIGVRYEMIDILIDTINNRLNDTDDEKLPATLAKYRSKLEETYEDLPAALSDLRTKAHDGNFYSIENTIYVNCFDKEPFEYVKLPNQITFATVDERRLITDIMQSIDGNILENIVEWTKAKINRYIEIQDDKEQENLLRSIHFRFIDDLALLYNDDRLIHNKYEELENIKLLDSNNVFQIASNLTMASCYNPFCDFQRFNLDYEYLSEDYNKGCKEDIRKVICYSLKVHSYFEKDDIDKLSNREFSIYFWKDYLTKKGVSIDIIKSSIEKGDFNSISCIPTKDCMKKPRELYSTIISSYVKNTEDWENKQPLAYLPNIEYDKDGNTLFSLLDFKKQLDFLDALYALFKINGQERRTQLLQWMIDSYDEKYDSYIDEYRDDEGALWKNSKNEEVQIKHLYALEYGDKMLEQYFGTLPQILNKDYFPTGEAFRTACDILKIVTIETSELIVEPIEKKNQNDKIKSDLLLYALVLAGYEDNEEWSNRYDEYKSVINGINFWCCKAISLRYSKDESISQKLKKFYHEEDSTEFYFVKSLEDKSVFLSYIEGLMDYLGIEAEKDFVISIMDGKDVALDLAKANNNLMLDDDFKDELNKLIPGIKRELNGNEAKNEDIQDDGQRHTFTTYTNDNVDDEQSQEFETDDNENYTDNNEESESTSENEKIINEKNYIIEDEDELEGINDKSYSPEENEFTHATKETFLYNGNEDERVCEHYRDGTWVRPHMRDGIPVSGYWRNGSTVGEHTRTANTDNVPTDVVSRSEQTETNTSSSYHSDNNKENNPNEESVDGNESTKLSNHPDKDTTHERNPRRNSTYTPAEKSEGKPYSDMGGWDRTNRGYTPKPPKPFSPEDVEKFKSYGVSRTLDVLEPTKAEIDELNRILGEDLSAEQVADQNHLAQLRLYNNLKDRGMNPEESKEDFVRNAHFKNEHTLHGGKYIHKCSAAGGIMYISPSIWNKIADDNCVVCVYLGAKANEFMYFNSIEDILEWIGEDDIVIKLTGEEKADVVEELYSGVLKGVKGTAYTLIRINSNEKHNSLFAPVMASMNNNKDENEDEY